MVSDWGAEKVTVRGVMAWRTVLLPSWRMLAMTFSWSASISPDLRLMLAMVVSSSAEICWEWLLLGTSRVIS